MRLVIGFMLLGLLAVLAVPAASSSVKDGGAARRPAPRKRIGRSKQSKRARRPASKSRLARREPAA
ncbi:MAG TPA: hypothetical protein PKA61_14545 [Nitrospira sp.]|nr:hypothetical protein [Nitrospira sp.]